MAAFRRKAAQLQIQLRGKPRIPTGFLLSPPATQRSGKGEDDTMYFNLYYSYIIFLYACQHSFQKERPPSGGKCRRGVGAGMGPHPVRKEIK